MDFNLKQYGFSTLSNFFKRNEYLSTITSVWHSKSARKKLFGVLFILSGLSLAPIAYQVSRSHALHLWKKKNPPHLSIFQSLIISHDYKAFTETRILKRLYRSLPMALDNDGSVWLSTNGFWILILPRKPSAQQAPLLFAHESLAQHIQKDIQQHPDGNLMLSELSRKYLPKAWNSYSWSWHGFKKVHHILKHQHLDMLPQPSIPEEKPPPLAEKKGYLDSRQIKY